MFFAAIVMKVLKYMHCIRCEVSYNTRRPVVKLRVQKMCSSSLLIIMRTLVIFPPFFKLSLLLGTLTEMWDVALVVCGLLALTAVPKLKHSHLLSPE